ncbi:MAG: hypothetical protein CMH54_09455 [Myxococcales bacterium]|nr:hypothetical protein [Myxococcales bacterium]
MKGSLLYWRSLKHYWRIHFVWGLGVALTAALIVSALGTGDTMDASLTRQAEARLGSIDLVVSTGHQTVRTSLADALSERLQRPVRPALGMRATSAKGSTVQLWGVGAGFTELSPIPVFRGIGPGEAVINATLASELELNVGDSFIVRVARPSSLPGDAPMARNGELPVALRLQVKAVAPHTSLGDFVLHAQGDEPWNLFVDLEWLQEQLSAKGRANLLLVGRGSKNLSASDLEAAIQQEWSTEDMGLQLASIGTGITELRPDAIFMDAVITDLLQDLKEEQVFTWFAYGIRRDSRETPYSFVAAVDPLTSELAADEIVVNQWLANDLEIAIGDAIELRVPVFQYGGTLGEAKRSFRVREILPMEGQAADPTLMPRYPGLHDAQHCRDWKPGIAIDLSKIRPADEDYWTAYRGAPKAFLSMDTAKTLWQNPYGNATAIRFDSARVPSVVERLKTQLAPSQLGIVAIPLRSQRLAGSRPANDFGMLFLGFSFLLMAAALLVSGLIFGFGILRRQGEVRSLIAMGFTYRRVARTFFVESMVVSALGAGFGIVIGLGLTHGLIALIRSQWSGVVGGVILTPSIQSGSLVIGGIAAMCAGWFATFLTVRKLGREQRRPGGPHGRRWGRIIALVCAVSVVTLLFGDSYRAVRFFLAGTFSMVGLLAIVFEVLTYVGRPGATVHKRRLAFRYLARRRGRSIAAITLVAVGTFLIVSVGANRHDPKHGADQRKSGTGGFSLYGESALPLPGDLNDSKIQADLGLGRGELKQGSVVSMRLREGDDASCRSAGQAQEPEILGLQPELLSQRRAFQVKDRLGGEGDIWASLHTMSDDGAIPAIGDEATVYWGFHRRVGDRLDFRDEQGRTRTLRIVGVLHNSVLQGRLIISERQFQQVFPSISGYRVFLVDTAAANTRNATTNLREALTDYGFHLVPAWQRLARFMEVENTYLSIFSLLGTLGMVLGIFGVGVLLLYNVIERRGELAVLVAIGFRRREIGRLLVFEHLLLVVFGILVGVGSATFALYPVLVAGQNAVPVAALGGHIGLMVCGAIFATVVAKSWALRQGLTPVLQRAN